MFAYKKNKKSQILYIIFVIFVSFSCKEVIINNIDNSYFLKTGLNKKNKLYDSLSANTLILDFQPDSSINNIIFLRNDSMPNFIKKNKLRLESNDSFGFPKITFLNNDKTQYLKMFLYYGDNEYEYSYFEVGYLKEEIKNNTNIINCKNFSTESGVKLGMSKNIFFQIKGETNDIMSDNLNNIYIYKYRLPNSHTYVNKHGMPSYSAIYYFKNDSLIKYSFGFDAP